MEKSSALSQSGFSLLEIILVVSLLEVILALSTTVFSPLSTQKASTLSSDVASLLKEAQEKAMAGETLGQGGASSFGVHFANTSFTLFKGTSFNSTDSLNFTESIPTGLTIIPNLPCPSPGPTCNNVVFTQITGEVNNFSSSQNTLCVKDSLGISSTLLTFNFLGVIDETSGGC